MSSQEAPKAVLVDEFGPDVVCEHLGGIVDHWLMDVAKSPDGVGYAIVSGPADELLARMNRRESIYGQIEWRFLQNPELARSVVVLEGAAAPSIKVQLFRSKKDDQSLLSKGVKWDLTFPISKPLAFYQSAEDGGICPSTNETKQFTDLLLANPSLRGHVVFHEVRKFEFEKRKKDFLERSHPILRQRLRFFRSRIYYNGGPHELWLVPSKR